ncbi:MAG: hypothetical protein IJ491_04780 [Clostridia bacterium]|nr:hypothetical protein [Clostridia bacterium]
MENNYNKFRRAAFGGFNREDVISYIEKMKNEFFDYKKEVDQTVSQLNEKIRELETICEAMDTPEIEEIVVNEEAAEPEMNPVSDINEATQKLRMVADELCKSLCDFMDRVSENAVSVVIEKKTVAGEIAVDTEDSVEEKAVEEYEEIAVEAEEVTDKVSSILKATDSFCCSTEAVEEATVKKENEPEKRNILDILGGASFLK